MVFICMLEGGARVYGPPYTEEENKIQQNAALIDDRLVALDPKPIGVGNLHSPFGGRDAIRYWGCESSDFGVGRAGGVRHPKQNPDFVKRRTSKEVCDRQSKPEIIPRVLYRALERVIFA